MIGFLHPWLLAGLVLAGIPILLHLVQRRQPPVVVFPAVRYLVDTTREHQRRLKLRHWLLLLVRTLLIIALVLAAAGPTAPSTTPGPHAPTALALILDNSLSSGAVVNGTPRYTILQQAARRILQRANPEDQLWLILADGLPRRGSRAELERLVDSSGPSDLRLDLGQALQQAEQVLATQQRQGEIVLLTDLQRSALSPARVTRPFLVLRPGQLEVRNLGVSAIDVGPQPWPVDGGRVTVSVAGDSATTIPVAIRLGTRPPRQALVTPGAPATTVLGGLPPGWWTIEAELDPDELLADNRALAAVRIAPVARVQWDTANRYLAAAAEVLRRNGRIQVGREVVMDALGGAASVLEPPTDPARLGALNRELAARGVPWQFGALVQAPGAIDSNPLVTPERVLKRYALVSSQSGQTGVILRVGGEPWLVRSHEVVLIGSRLDPEWTTLPLSASFVPFVDALVNRIARGELALERGSPGRPLLLPDRVTAVRRDQREWNVEGGAAFRPPETGVYYLLAGGDTVGAIAVNPDPRESILEGASDGDAKDLWSGATFAEPERGVGRVFSLGTRSDLRGPLLWAALVLGAIEVLLASVRRKQA